MYRVKIGDRLRIRNISDEPGYLPPFEGTLVDIQVDYKDNHLYGTVYFVKVDHVDGKQVPPFIQEDTNPGLWEPGA